MRFLHNDVAPIAAFIVSRDLRLFDCDVAGHSAPVAAEMAALDAYNAESNRLWGDAPTRFFFVTRAEIPIDLGLRVAIERAENIPSEIALCAYFDGGIISISKEMEEFQSNARDASWWQLGRWSPERKN